MDFYDIRWESDKDDNVEVFPDFKTVDFEDVMLRGGNVIAFWDAENEIWSTSEKRLIKIVDNDIKTAARNIQRRKAYIDKVVIPRTLSNSSSKSWKDYIYFKSTAPDDYRLLDSKLTWQNTKVCKEDYVSKRLPYSLEPGDYSAFDELIGYLYEKDEREKIEWAIGAIVAGKAKDIQKFIVLFGDRGTGKSTIMGIVEDLFQGYTTSFDAKALAQSNSQFSTGAFKDNPLVAIQHDGDLSRIEDNTTLNSLVSHETINVNPKYEKSFPARINAFLFMGTNKPVKITDAKSGLRRRLIDVRPTGNKFAVKDYRRLMARIKGELGAIAWHCKEVFDDCGADYYNDYEPTDMMFRTNFMFNFVAENYIHFKADNGVSYKAAYEMYSNYCTESGYERMPKYKFKDEFENYFEEMKDSYYVDGKQFRNYFYGFKSQVFDKDPNHKQKLVKEKDMDIPELTMTKSLLDERYQNCKAQYANADGKPLKAWDDVTTTLKDLDTTKLHYILVPDETEIVMDFDLKDEQGNKSKELNLKEASKWPPTYMEYSKGGGVHSHYIYDGDPKELSRVIGPGIEVKVFTGNSSLRRKLSYCNDIPVAHLAKGSLPLKEEKVRTFEGFKNEKMLRSVISRHLRKEIVGFTKPSIDLINDCLKEAYESGMTYDVTDMRPAILAFATNSSHNAGYCIKVVNGMQFKSEEQGSPQGTFDDDRLMFFDVEVFPNLFIVCHKFEFDQEVHKMINPSARDISWLVQGFKLVGFNNRRYDNHILYGRMLGKNNQELYELSQRIINGSSNALYSEAYNLSYTDVYDFSAAANKKSLKKWEIELGITHLENEYPWDQPVPEELWDQIADYCCNDVRATEAVFHELKGDWAARECLAALTGMSVNTSTNALSARFIFGDDKKPQDQFIYTDLSKEFPGYRYDSKGIPKEEYLPNTKIVSGKSIYMGMDPSEGGFVYAKKGIFHDVVLLDIASMHPSTIEWLKLFGEKYTQRYLDIKQARIYIKHGEVDKVREMFDGKLIPYLNDENSMKALSLAFKTVLNSVYGLTTAHFDNKFRDPRNVDNIVAKRGGLFMIKLLHEVEKRGYTVVHIKTDSIKIADSGTMNTYDIPEIVKFVMDFGKEHGYNFEHEATYERMCLINDAVYIAKYDHEGLRGESKEKDKHRDQWTATGEQFKEPFVFKTLFSKEPLVQKDYQQTFSVTTALYLDTNEGLPDVKPQEAERKRIESQKKKIPMDDPQWKALDERLDILSEEIARGHDYHFVGKVGSFTPVIDGIGGGWLVRKKEKGYDSANGASGYRWMKSEMVSELGYEEMVDIRYFTALANKAIENISEFGDFEAFRSNDAPPWTTPCGDKKVQTCFDCPKFDNETGTCKAGYKTNLIEK